MMRAFGEKIVCRSRALCNTAAKSKVLSSEIHLTEDKVSYEAFFLKAVLLARRFSVSFVYMDDSSCTNRFNLPMVSVSYRDDSDTVHAIACDSAKENYKSVRPVHDVLVEIIQGHQDRCVRQQH